MPGKDSKVYLSAALYHIGAAREAMSGLVDSEAATSLNFVARLVEKALNYGPTTDKTAGHAEAEEVLGTSAKPKAADATGKPYHWLTESYEQFSVKDSPSIKALKVCVWDESVKTRPAITSDILAALRAAPKKGEVQSIEWTIGTVKYRFNAVLR